MRKRSVAVEVQGISVTASVGTPKLIVGRKPKDIEEKIEYIQEQINEVRKDLERESKERRAQIADLSKEMSAKTQETQVALRNIKSKVEKTLGGVTGGVFGVLLMFYAAVARYFT